MKISRNTLIFLMIFTAFPASAFAELKPLLPEKSLWSVVHDKPAIKNWTTTYPLPKDKKVRGKLDTEDGTWPSAKKYVYMTSELILPDDYEPGNLYARYLHDDSIQIAINGTMVVQRVGAGVGHYFAALTFTKRVPSLLKPGKNIIAARGFSTPHAYGILGLDLYLEEKKAGEEDDDSGFSMPDRRPRDVEDEDEDEESEDDLTEAEKLIVKGMNFLKEKKEKPAVEALVAAAKEDKADFQANCILGMLYLTKLYKPAVAMEYMQACVKIDAQNPCVLNNYGVAAMETKKYTDALKAWRQLAKNYPTLSELQQNVGFLTELVDNNMVKLKDDERAKLEALYREVCGAANVNIDKTAGFLLMPLHDGVGANPDYAEIFVQEYKRGKEKVTGNPYEVKRTYFQK